MSLHRRTSLRRRRAWHNQRGLETLEARQLLSADPILDGQPLIISEVVAENNSSLHTRTRSSVGDAFVGETDSPDWIELMNVSEQRVNLEGMHLTDNPEDLRKWSFPAGTEIEAGEFLVVFASGNDLLDPSLDEQGYLHTDFRLASRGEYLALTQSDGTIVHEFAPTVPAQRVDVSYNVPMTTRQLLGPEATLEYGVPEDDSLSNQWTLPTFSDPSWQADGATSPIGFERGAGSDEIGENLGSELVRRKSIEFARGALNVIESMPFTQAGKVDQWSFHSETTNAITPVVLRAIGDDYEIVGVGRTRTSDGTGAQTFDFDLQEGTDVVDEGYFFGFKDGDNQSDNPGVVRYDASETESVRRFNGPLSGRTVAGQQLTGGRSFGRVFSVQVNTRAILSGPINTDVEAALSDKTSLYVRYPFEVQQVDTLKSLQLDIRYDDGFVAYLNGVEVARRNTPNAIRFDSVATADRSLADVNAFETINISEYRDRLIEGDNVLAVHVLNDDAASPELLLDAQLVGIDVYPAIESGYALTTTPGLLNATLYDGFVAAPTLSQTRGIYNESFLLELSVPESEGARIYYTLDSSKPAPDNPAAQLYEEPILISGTTTFRATGFEEGQLPSLTETHTFIFPSDVVTQETLQPVVTEDPNWGPQLGSSLVALPTISIVTPNQISVVSEVETSMELIFPDGSPGFQVDAGIAPSGGTSLSFPKLSYRLTFRNLYGPSTFEHDVFNDPEGVTDFNQILLRSGSSDTPFWPGPLNGGKSSYIRNRWAFDRQMEMGQPAPRGEFVQVYLNGTYWGQYHMMERPNSDFMASHFGGDSEDYDVLNAGRVIDGDDVAWNALLDSLDQGYDKVKEYLDVVNFADYMILQFYGGNEVDWIPDRNWIAARKREPGAGFQFFSWDSDGILRTRADAEVVTLGGPDYLWTLSGGVRQYPEFLELMAERTQKYFFDGGMFSDERLRGDLDALADEIRVSMIAETARWGSGLYTPETWEESINWMKDTFAPESGPSRVDTVIEQMRHAGLFPLSDRPEFSVSGQAVVGNELAPNELLSMSAPAGEIYYTLDGSDPREVAPTLSSTQLVSETSPARLLIPTRQVRRIDWQAVEYDDTNWTPVQNSIGYDINGELSSLINTDVEEMVRGVNSSAFVRFPFELSDPNRFDTLELSVRYDDGFIAYLNGVEVASRSAPKAVRWNSRATTPRANVEAIEFETFNLSRVKDLLRPGQNVLAIHALNSLATNVDLLITPVLRAATVVDTGASPQAILYDESIQIPANATIKARTVWGDQWSTLREATTVAEPFPVRISEVMYHPADPTTAEIAAGYTDPDDFEFIELVNTSNATVDLIDLQFVQAPLGGEPQGIEFEFGQGTIQQLGPGERVLVVENQGAFRIRYGDQLPVAGQWSGGLNNNTEQITLVVGGNTVQQFSYDDDWYPQTDGTGPSLEIIDAAGQDLDAWGEPEAWQASFHAGGTPGTAPFVPVAGDSNGDGFFDSDDLMAVLQAGKYEDGVLGNATFAEGDWDGDGDFTSDDLIFALQFANYAKDSPRVALPAVAHDQLFAAWPEPDKKRKSRTN